MHTVKAQDVVDAHPLTYPESCSEEGEELGSCGDMDSGSVVSSLEAVEPGIDVSPEPLVDSL
jgi:hypothetical protein